MSTWNEWLRITRIQVTPFVAKAALIILKQEVDKIRLQFARIKEDVTKLDYNRQESRSMKETITTLFADIHFLLICLDKLELLLHMLEKQLPNNRKLADVRKRYEKSLKQYNDFRNHLEHIDERIERGVTDLGNLSGTMFTFDGKSFDIGATREQEVEHLFNEILTSLEAPD